MNKPNIQNKVSSTALVTELESKGRYRKESANAYATMARFRKMAEDQGWDKREIDDVLAYARGGRDHKDFLARLREFTIG